LRRARSHIETEREAGRHHRWSTRASAAAPA
jgi:hypothetical protein